MFEQLLPGLAHAPNVHPLFVHFPIVLWSTAALFWTIGLARRSDRLFEVGTWLLGLGTLGGVTASISGLVAAGAMGHESPGHELVHIHRNFMLATTSLAVVVTVAAIVLRRRTDSLRRVVLLVLLGLTLVVMTVGADRGAELVFRHGIGTLDEPLPVSAGHHHGEGHDDGHDDGRESGSGHHH